MTSRSNKADHVSVMLEECLQGFEGSLLTTFFEGTVGAGGHAEAILKAHPEIERYIGCDQDPQALQIATSRLRPWKDKVELIRGNFIDLDTILSKKGIKEVNGFFLTLECHPCNLIKAKKGSVL
jgi:16S rRNA (cytosine1402-N4)-methyltransferase